MVDPKHDGEKVAHARQSDVACSHHWRMFQSSSHLLQDRPKTDDSEGEVTGHGGLFLLFADRKPSSVGIANGDRESIFVEGVVLVRDDTFGKGRWGCSTTYGDFAGKAPQQKNIAFINQHLIDQVIGPKEEHQVRKEK